MDLITQPFPHVVLPGFFTKEESLALLKTVTKFKFKHIESDLFSFLQTNDLSNSKDKAIINFLKFLKSKNFRNKLAKVTGIKVSGKIDLFASCYNSTHYLLPHDDQLDGRKIAFFYYLSSPKEGGDLCLYDAAPKRIVKRIKPNFNKFSFFVVSSKSFHEVEEVVKGQRIALSGWLH